MPTVQEYGLQLIDSAEKGDLAKVKSILAACPECINEKKDDITKSTALIEASENNHTEVVRALIKAGANLDETSDIHYSPLIIAAAKGHNSIVIMLIESGADVNKLNNKGNNALMFAAYHNQDQALKILLAAGADIAISNDFAKALDIAIKKNSDRCIRLLEDAENGIIPSLGEVGIISKTWQARLSASAREINLIGIE